MWNITSTVGPIMWSSQSATWGSCPSSGDEGFVSPPGVSPLSESPDSLDCLPNLKTACGFRFSLGFPFCPRFTNVWSCTTVVLKLTVNTGRLEKCLKCRFLGPNPRDGDWAGLECESCEWALVGSIPVFAEQVVPASTLRNSLGFLGFQHD